MTIEKPLAYVTVFACLVGVLWASIASHGLFQSNLQLGLDNHSAPRESRLFDARFLYSMDPSLLNTYPFWKEEARSKAADEILKDKHRDGDEETTLDEVIESLMEHERRQEAVASATVNSKTSGLFFLLMLAAGLHFLSAFIIDPSWRVLQIQDPPAVFNIGLGVMALIAFVFAGALQLLEPLSWAAGYFGPVAFQVTLLALIAVNVNSTGGSFLRDIGLEEMSLGRAVKIGIAAYAAFFPLQIILSPQAEILSYIIGRRLEVHPAIEQFIETSSSMVKLGIAVQVVVFAPLIEEFYFRGVFLNCLNRHLSRWAASIICGLVFGLLHGSFASVFLITALGIHLCYLRQKTGSLIPCIVVHFLFNAFAIIQLLSTS